MIRRLCAVGLLAVLLAGCGQRGVVAPRRAVAARQVWCPSIRMRASREAQRAELRAIRRGVRAGTLRSSLSAAQLVRILRRDWRRIVSMRRFDASRLVGWDVRKAQTFVQRHGCTWRVVERDGIDLAATADLRPDRVDADVAHGRVTGVGVS